MTFKIDELTLITGADINLSSLGVKIHQPTLKEIALIGGEKKFFQSLNMFYIDSAPLWQFIDSMQDIEPKQKEVLKQTSTVYDSLLFLLQVYSEPQLEEDLDSLIELMQNIFYLMIPTHTFSFDSETAKMILTCKKDSHSIVVDGEDFLKLKQIATQVFLLDIFFKRDEEDTMSEAAKRIAEKMAKAEEKIQEEKKGEEDDSQFALIVSILGLHHTIDYLSSLTIYQIYDQFERFNLHGQFDQAMQAALAGASEVEMVNWYKKI